MTSARAQAFKSAANAEGEKELRIAEAIGKAGGFSALAAATKDQRALARTRLFLDTATRALPRARVILPLTSLPLDLRVREPGASSETTPIELPTPRPTDAPTETWREKMSRLQERER